MSADQILKRLVAMKSQPDDGWTQRDIISLCRSLGIDCFEPGGSSSNVVVSHPRVDGLLTIPARRPLKAIYVMLTVQLVEAVLGLK